MSRRAFCRAYKEAQPRTPGLPLDAIVHHTQSSLSNQRAAAATRVIAGDQYGQKHREVRGVRSDEADVYSKIRFLCPYKHDPNAFLEQRKSWYAEAAHLPTDLISVSPIHHLALLPDRPSAADLGEDEDATSPSPSDTPSTGADGGEGDGPTDFDAGVESESFTRDVDADAEPDLIVNSVVLGAPMMRDVWNVNFSEPFNPLQPATRRVELPDGLQGSTGGATVSSWETDNNESAQGKLADPASRHHTTRIEPIRLTGSEYPVAMGFLPQTLTLRSKEYSVGNVLGSGTGRPLRCAVVAPYAPPGAVLRMRVLGAVGLLRPRVDAEVVRTTMSQVSSTPAVPDKDDESFSQVYRRHSSDAALGEVEWVVVGVVDSAQVRGLRRIGRLGDMDDNMLTTIVDFLRWENVMVAGAAQPAPPRDVAVLAEKFIEPASATVVAVQQRLNSMAERRALKDNDEVPTFTAPMAANRKAFAGRVATMGLLKDAYASWGRVIRGEEVVSGLWTGNEGGANEAV